MLYDVPEVLYFSFPWTKFFNLLNFKKSDKNQLLKYLNRIKKFLHAQRYVVTVCQHTNLVKYQKYFTDIGITHVFWPHFDEKVKYFTESSGIKVFRFPFVPTLPQYEWSSETIKKKYLCFIIGKKTNKIYDFIYKLPSIDKRYIINNYKKWDYENVEKDEMMSEPNIRLDSTKVSTTIESYRIMQDSTFTICPLDPSVNSIQLWESIGNGAIPVIFSESHYLPGNKSLWDEGTVFCSLKKEEISALPDRLETIVNDHIQLQRKRSALRQLWLLYGPDCFIYDIQRLFLSLSNIDSDVGHARTKHSAGRLLAMAALINQTTKIKRSEIDLFLLGCNSLVLVDHVEFLKHYDKDIEFRKAYKKALISSKSQYSEAMQRNLEFKNVVLN